MHVVILGSRQCIHVVRWANTMAERGYTVDLLTMYPPGETFSGAVNVIELPFSHPYGYLLNLPAVRKYIRRHKPDLIHSFYAFGHGFLGRMSGFKPHLLSVLGSDVFEAPQRNALFRKVIVKNIISADYVCSTSQVMGDYIPVLCGKKVELSITPFGVDTDLFKPIKIKRNSGFDFVVGSIKAMKPKYGVDILIRAFARFSKLYHDQNFRLVLVGEGEQTDELKKLANQLDLGDSCVFTGRIPHQKVPEYLAGMDVYVAVSRAESFGVAILEASSCEKPVIVSDAGGLPEVVKHEKTGLVVPRENVEKTTEALIRLYQDKKLADELGKQGRAHIQQHYEWKESVDIMEDVYRKVAGKSEYRTLNGI